MDKQIPVGVKVTRIINFISIGLSALTGIFMAMVTVANFVKAAQNAGTQANFIVLLIAGLISVSIGFTPGIILIFINKGLKQLNKSARIGQIVVSFLLLLAFPWGTILNFVILWYMLFDKKTKEAFSISLTTK